MISIHASREGSDHCRYDHRARAVKISIHASREGSDIPAQADIFSLQDFNPRFPRGKRHRLPRRLSAALNFNPHFPRGKRRSSQASCVVSRRFQSTLPAGEATLSPSSNRTSPQFQSTLPAGEATKQREVKKNDNIYFNPRFPRGKRHFGCNVQ